MYPKLTHKVHLQSIDFTWISGFQNELKSSQNDAPLTLVEAIPWLMKAEGGNVVFAVYTNEFQAFYFREFSRNSLREVTFLLK